MFLDPFNVFEAELGVNDLHITRRVDIALDVDDVRVVEGTDHLEDAIYGTYMGQEGIAKTCSC